MNSVRSVFRFSYLKVTTKSAYGIVINLKKCPLLAEFLMLFKKIKFNYILVIKKKKK